MGEARDKELREGESNQEINALQSQVVRWLRGFGLGKAPALASYSKSLRLSVLICKMGLSRCKASERQGTCGALVWPLVGAQEMRAFTMIKRRKRKMDWYQVSPLVMSVSQKRREKQSED